MLKLYNTLSRKVEDFRPIDPPNVSLYTCGQTVYDYTHVGHLRKYTNDDILKRTLVYNGFKVKHVQNVTDVGHLTSDADTGEDKLEKGAKREGKTVWEVARFYEKHFYDSLVLMNVLPPDIVCRATEHIESQIKLIQRLEEKGFTYEAAGAVYFDTSKFEGYSRFSGQELKEKKAGAREEVVVDREKRNPSDFVLWFKRVRQYKDHQMHWASPWGDGFPGWHIECSAMSMEYLGPQIDIHTGGIDHISVHHPNEVAQSEGATGKHFVNYWVHYEFLLVDGQKMSKSLQNFYTIEDVAKKGFSPMSLRYLFLSAHYRQKLNFTWEALEGAQNSVGNLSLLARECKSKEIKGGREVEEEFLASVNDDLNIPKALSVIWDGLKKERISFDQLLRFDKVLGLGLADKQVSIEVKELIKKRDKLRAEKKFEEADEIRKQIVSKGYIVRDTDEGTAVF